MTLDTSRAKRLTGWGMLFLLLFAASVPITLTGGFAWLDRSGYALLAGLNTPLVTDLMILFTTLGNGQVVLALAACLLVIAVSLRHFAEALAIILFLLLGDYLNDLLKEWFARPRPAGLQLIPLPDSYSFPSGHAMISAPFYLFVAYLLDRLYRNRQLSRILLPAAGVTALLICASRIYLGVHYTSDVLAGICGGAAWLFAVMALYEFALRGFFSRTRKTPPAFPLHRE